MSFGFNATRGPSGKQLELYEAVPNVKWIIVRELILDKSGNLHCQPSLRSVWMCSFSCDEVSKLRDATWDDRLRLS